MAAQTRQARKQLVTPRRPTRAYAAPHRRTPPGDGYDRDGLRTAGRVGHRTRPPHYTARGTRARMARSRRAHRIGRTQIAGNAAVAGQLSSPRSSTATAVMINWVPGPDAPPQMRRVCRLGHEPALGLSRLCMGFRHESVFSWTLYHRLGRVLRRAPVTWWSHRCLTCRPRTWWI